MPGHDFEVIKLWYDARQFADVIWAALSVSDESESKSKNQDLMYFTIPACVLEYAHVISDDRAPVTCQSVAGSIVIDLTEDADKEELGTELESDVEILDWQSVARCKIQSEQFAMHVTLHLA